MSESAQMLLDEYLDYLCQKRRCNREQLQAWLGDRGLRPGPCYCSDFSACQGWRLYFEEEFDSMEEYLSSTCEVT